MKNGRNCGCHEVTYNTDNGDYFCNREVVIVVFVDIVVTVVIVVSVVFKNNQAFFCLYQELSSKKSGATWNYSRKRHLKRRNYSRKLAWKGKNMYICTHNYNITSHALQEVHIKN